MTDHDYLEIPNWDGTDGFQHYKGRDPIWIKNYTKLLAKDEYLALSAHRRGVLHGIWLAYASSNRRLRSDARSLSSRLNIRVTVSDLKALSHAGFIVVSASSLLASRKQSASPHARPRARSEEEKEIDTTKAVQKSRNEARAAITQMFPPTNGLAWSDGTPIDDLEPELDPDRTVEVDAA